MKYLYASLLLSLALLLLPSTSSATRLPVGLILELVQDTSVSQPDAIIDGLVIPLSLQAVLDSSQLSSGRKLFLRVSEDVMVNDELLFGAGAIACGYIGRIEKDAEGHCVAIGMVMVQVQATDGSQVALRPTVLTIKTVVNGICGMRVSVNASVTGVTDGALARV